LAFGVVVAFLLSSFAQAEVTFLSSPLPVSFWCHSAAERRNLLLVVAFVFVVFLISTFAASEDLPHYR
jgi:hypothetical protein